AEVQVDALTGRLVDVQGSLNAVLAAYSSRGYASGFVIQSAGGAYSIAPTQGSILVAPVTLPLQRRTGAETLQLLLNQVSKTSGFHVGFGMVPLNGMANTRVTIGARGEADTEVLAR